MPIDSIYHFMSKLKSAHSRSSKNPIPSGDLQLDRLRQYFKPRVKSCYFLQKAKSHKSLVQEIWRKLFLKKKFPYWDVFVARLGFLRVKALSKSTKDQRVQFALAATSRGVNLMMINELARFAIVAPERLRAATTRAVSFNRRNLLSAGNHKWWLWRDVLN